MKYHLKHFLHDEAGGISVDWIVLTAVLIATGMAVINTVSGGMENLSYATTEDLRGQIITQSFGPDNTCDSGIEGLRAREERRIAEGGTDPIDVDAWMETYTTDLSDDALLQERERAAETAQKTAQKGDDVWTRENTILGLLECGLSLRGLI